MAGRHLHGFTGNKIAQPLRRREGWMLGRSTAATWSQWLYHSYATLSRAGEDWRLDASGMPAAGQGNGLAGNPVLQIELPVGAHLSAVRSTGCRPVGYGEDSGFGYLALRVPESGVARFSLEFGAEPLGAVVSDAGTCDVLDLEAGDASARLALRVYGEQRLCLRLPFRPARAEAVGAGVAVAGLAWNADRGVSELRVRGQDIQGEEGIVTLYP